MTSLIGQGKDYFDLVKAIGESKSKQEEDRIVSEEVIYLKKAVQQQSIPKKKLKELVIRSIYVEMLGQDASFTYIKAVELCASTSIAQKRVGYLAASLCFSPTHEFRFMLVSQIQRDMKSSSMLDVCTALIAVCKLITEDMIPAVIGDVFSLLKHDMEFVRKKAVSAIHRFYQMDKRSVLDHVDKVRRALCDKDPSVMAATLPLFQAMIQDDVMAYKDLVPSFVVILKQIVEHRLPREFDYHRIPSPWIQMNLLRILALLGRGDQQSSEGMYEVLVEVMKRADTGINVGYAIVYECIKTVTTIYPNAVLLDAAATAISRFIRSESHNLKYIGIKGLAAIVKDHPRYAADHQLAVIDCLEDPDETLKRKTLDLLFRMTNAVNVEFIVEKLLSFLATSVDDHFRSDLVQQITQCAERFAPSNTWYVQTIIRVFELAGDKVKSAVAQTLTQLIADGAEAEEEDTNANDALDDELRREAVEHFLDLLEKPKIPAILAQTMAWVLGEYGYLSSSVTKEELMDRLCALAQSAREPETKAMVMSALAKLIAQAGHCPSKVLSTIQFYAQSHSLEVQQRCLEILALLKHPETLVEVLPVDASCEDLEVDDSLSFLNDFVQAALNTGARPYAPPAEFLASLEEDDGGDKKAALKITPYERPKIPTVAPGAIGIVNALPGAAAPAAPAGPTPLGPAITNQQPPQQTISTAQGNQLINPRAAVSGPWGKKPEPPPPAPAAPAPPAASPVAPSSSSSVSTATAVETTSSATNGQTAQGPWGGSNGASNVPASLPAQPPQPRVLTEKEKMAAALFGGMGGGAGKAGSSTASGVGSRRRSTASTTSTVASPAQPEPAPAPAPAPVSSGGGGDLFADMQTMTATAAPATPSRPAPAASSNELLDLLGSPAAPAPAPQPAYAQPTAVPPPAAAPLDIFSLSPAPASVTPVYSPAVHNTPPPAPAAASNSISDIFANIDLTGQTVAPSVDHGIQPFAIPTPEFGRRWGSTPFEQRFSIVASSWPRFDLECLRRALPPGYHHVESIPATQEAIFAATATTMGAVLLLHAKLQPARRTVDVILKATARELTAQEQGRVEFAFQSFRG